MFSGLRSRCSRPFAWAWSSASATGESSSTVSAVLGHTELEHADDVRVVNGAREASLAQEASHAVGARAVLGRQELQRHAVAQQDVLGQIDRAHAAAPEEPLDAIGTVDHRADEQLGIFLEYLAVVGADASRGVEAPSAMRTDLSRVGRRGHSRARVGGIAESWELPGIHREPFRLRVCIDE
jgi:hypothetical protein